MEWKSSVLCDLKSITIHFSNKKSSVIHQLCLLITRTEVRLSYWGVLIKKGTRKMPTRQKRVCNEPFL